MEVVEHGPVVAHAAVLLDADAQGAVGDDDLDFGIPEVAHVEALCGVAEGLAAVARVPVAVVVGVLEGSLDVVGDAALADRHEGCADFIGEVEGADDLGAVVVFGTDAAGGAVAVVALHAEAVGAVRKSGDVLIERADAVAPALDSAVIHAAVDLVVACALELVLPAGVAVVLVGEVEAGHQPRGVLGVVGSGLQKVGHALLLADELPEAVVEEGEVGVGVGLADFGAEHDATVEGLKDVEVLGGVAGHVVVGGYRPGGDGIARVHVALVGEGIQAVVVAETGVNLPVGAAGVIGVLDGRDHHVEAHLVQLGVGGPVIHLLAVVLQPQAGFDVVEVVRATLFGKDGAHPRRVGHLSLNRQSGCEAHTEKK